MSRKVLFVDDEKNVLKAIERLFMDDDLELLFADSAETALSTMELNPDVAVVVSDYRMPGMNGVELLRRIYARFPQTVRMVLSGFADTAAVVEAINVGHISRFIPKPWEGDELREAVISSLERRENNRVSSSCDVDHESILRRLPVGVLLLDVDGLVVWLNDAAATLLGTSREEAMNQPLRRFISTIDSLSKRGGHLSFPAGDCFVTVAENGDGYSLMVLTPSREEVG